MSPSIPNTSVLNEILNLGKPQYPVTALISVSYHMNTLNYMNYIYYTSFTKL